MTGTDLRTAGTTLVVRDSGKVEVLMLLRHQSMRFFGGFWVFPGGAVESTEGAAAAACRETREEAGLTLSTDALLPWARWITPTAVRRRFDTHFFLARLPSDQQPRVADAESVEVRWVDPGIWTTAASTGEFPLTPPTSLVLREFWTALQLHGSFDRLMERERHRMIRPVMPKLLEGGVVVMPWDEEYNTLRGEGMPWDEAAIQERSGWPSRLTAAVHPA